MKLRDQRGEPVRTGRLLGKGGEAEVYAIEGRPASVAKVYFTYSQERAAKLQVMVNNPPADSTRKQGHVSICWPESILFDEANRCMGFIMPCVDFRRNRELFKLYNPKDRAAEAPGFTWAYLLKAAENLSVVVASIHAREYVIGDVNESNFFVSDQALVTVVDCDSMQVPTPGGVLRCTVWKPEYLAPELHGCDLKRIDRTKSQDDFALAVLIFHLLMEGFHPYAGVWKGSGDPPLIEERIRRGDSPYGGSPHIMCSPFAPPFTILPEELRKLTARAFGRGHANPADRPTAREWHRALEAAGAQLLTCRKDALHRFSGHLRDCPWCERAGASAQTALAQQPLKPVTFTRPVAAAATVPKPAPLPVRPRAASPPPTPFGLPAFTPPLQRSQAVPRVRSWQWRLGYSFSQARTGDWLLPLLSAVLSVALASALNAPTQWRFQGVVLLLAGLFGIVLNLRRRRGFRALVNLWMLGSGASMLSTVRSATPSLLESAFWAMLASRSLLLQLRPTISCLEAQGRRQASLALLMGATMVVPVSALVGAMSTLGIARPMPAPMQQQQNRATLSRTPKPAAVQQSIQQRSQAKQENVQGGDFTAMFPWYLTSIQTRTAQQWHQQDIDPSTPADARVDIAFLIHRDGSQSDVHVQQSSGYPTLDISCVRAIERVDGYGPLPGGYTGSTLQIQYHCRQSSR